MLWSAFAAAVLAVVLVCCYVTDVISETERYRLRMLNAGRFDRTYQRNRAARRPDLRVASGGRHARPRGFIGKR
jgi:hypothetical protein